MIFRKPSPEFIVNPMPHSLIKLVCAVTLGVMLSSCSPSVSNQSQSWETYHNSRFNFEFPYPSNWIAAPPPANRDGQAFSDPLQPEVEIRGWAGYQLSTPRTPNLQPQTKPKPTLLRPNFTTEQGVSGELKVEIGAEMSAMNLALMQGNVQYNWRGQAPSRLFNDYYKFFYYVAGQYRVPMQRQQP